MVETALQPSIAAGEPPVASAAWVTIGRMRLQADNAEDAVEAARQAQRIAPQSDGAALLALEIAAAGKGDLSIPLLETYLSQPTARAEVRLDYARILLQARRSQEARVQLEQVTKAPPNQAANSYALGAPSPAGEAWLLLGLLDLEQKQLDTAEASLRRYLEISQNEGRGERQLANKRQAFLALSQLAEQRSDYNAADAWLQRIDAPDAAADTLSRRAALLARQGRVDDALRLIRETPLPSAPTPAAVERLKALAEIQVLRNNGRGADAYVRLNGLNRDAVLAGKPDADLLYDQAMLADELDRDHEVEPLLRQVIKLDPTHAHAYNALGYFFADRNERLPEARELIRKALSLSPKDPFITDSLGWVEFRMGNTAEAIRVLQQAYALRPDAEIATHLGEVLWTVGRQEEARQAWRDAQKLNPDLPVLRSTLQRLNVGTP